MQDFKVGQYEDANKKKSGVISSLLTAILILLLFLPLFSHLNPPPGQEGILVNLGEIDVGQGDDNAPAPKPEPEEKEPETAPENLRKKIQNHHQRLKSQKSKNLSRRNLW